VAEHEPNCKVYFALTKCDLLEQLPGVGTDASHLEPSPQESGTQSNHCPAAILLLDLIQTAIHLCLLVPEESPCTFPFLRGLCCSATATAIFALAFVHESIAWLQLLF